MACSSSCFACATVCAGSRLWRCRACMSRLQQLPVALQPSWSSTAGAPAWLRWLGSPPVHAALSAAALAGPGRGLLVGGWLAARRGAPDMDTLVGLGAGAAFAVSCVAAALPGLGWRTCFEEPAMLLGVVLLGRTLEQRAKLQASADMAALQARPAAPARHTHAGALPASALPGLQGLPASPVSAGRMAGAAAGARTAGGPQRRGLPRGAGVGAGGGRQRGAPAGRPRAGGRRGHLRPLLCGRGHLHRRAAARAQGTRCARGLRTPSGSTAGQSDRRCLMVCMESGSAWHRVSAGALAAQCRV